MLGWFDLSRIHLSVDTFKRRGWLNATFQHEVAHWSLHTGFGVAQHVVFITRATAVALSDPELVRNLEKLSAAMSLQNGRTHEGVASTVGLEYALTTEQKDLYQDMLDSLSDFYREAHQVFDDALKVLGVPAGGGARIAIYVGLLAQGSDILDDWGRVGLDMPYLLSSLRHHSPDLRLSKLIPLLSRLPAGTGAACERSYLTGTRPPVPAAILNAMTCKLIDQQTASVSGRALVPRLAAAIWGDGKKGRSGVSREKFVRIVDHALEDIARSPANPYWITTVNPARFGNVVRHKDVSPRDAWDAAELILVEPNGLPHPLPSGTSQNPLEGAPIPPGSALVSLYARNAPVGRFVASDKATLRKKLRDLTDDQFVFMKANYVLPSAFREICDQAQARGIVRDEEYLTTVELLHRLGSGYGFPTKGWVPPGKAWLLLHVGDFSELFRLLSPYLSASHPAQCLLMPSRAAERYALDTQLRDLDVGAFGYAIFKFSIEHFPLLIWPTAVLVAESILSDRKRMLAAGVRIIDNPDDELANMFGTAHNLRAFDCLRTHFEQGPQGTVLPHTLDQFWTGS